MKTLIIFLPLFLLTTPLFPQHTHSPYTGQTGSLSHDEVRQYLQGDGMGLARAAELNHYPGPKHVLELSEKLGISAEQKIATEEAFQTMKQEAMSLGAKIVEKEKELDAFFQSGKNDPQTLNKLLDEIASLNGRLRFTHLNAHLKMRALLTAEQVEAYDKLRGYK